MSLQDRAKKLEPVRHDLMNILTSLHYGCQILGSKASDAKDDEALVLLGEMLRRIEDGQAIVRRLVGLE